MFYNLRILFKMSNQGLRIKEIVLKKIKIKFVYFLNKNENHN